MQERETNLNGSSLNGLRQCMTTNELTAYPLAQNDKSADKYIRIKLYLKHTEARKDQQ